MYIITAAPKSEKSGDKAPRSKENTKENGAASAPADSTVSKSAAVGGAREAGGHGPKQRNENRGRSGKGKNGDSSVCDTLFLYAVVLSYCYSVFVRLQRPRDRRSGPEANTKRAPKDGGGSHNWGNEKDDLKEATAESRNGGRDDVDGDVDESAEAPEPQVAAPPAPVTFTYEEYLAKRNQSRSNQDAFGAIKMREVASALDGVKVEDTANEDYLVIGGLKEGKSTKVKDTKKKDLLELDFTNAALQPQERDNEKSDRSSAGGRGDRRPREKSGGRPSGGPQARIDIMDQSAFPSL